MTRIDTALLAVRLCFGLSMAWHGLNKMRGPRGIAGTSSWFASIGMRKPELNARLACATEIIAGVCFAAGFATPLASAALIGLMVVAIVTVHWRVGYFVFLPNQGWEYCFCIAVVAGATAISGPGTVAVDHHFAADFFGAGTWAVLAVPLGIIAALCQLSLFWRPARTEDRP
ncbi:MAG: DoxX family protein [Actinobacteria bacterium]|nr:DoxX family protein [Actinomycetota bacterium]